MGRNTRAGTLVPALLLCALCVPIPAATPAGGTLSDTGSTSLAYTFPFSPFANVSGQTETIYTCNTGPTDPCDVYNLTVTMSAAYMTAHPNAFMRISAATTSSGSDIDLQLADQNDNNLAQLRDNPPDQPSIDYPVAAGSTLYHVQVVPGSPHEGGNVTIELFEGAPPPPPDEDGDGVADADDNCPGTPADTSVDTQGCPLAAGDPATCTLPGKVLLTDATGDTENDVTGTDLLSLAIVQPRQAGTGDAMNDQLLAFQIKIDADAEPDPTLAWFATFENANGSIQGVRMTGDAAGNAVLTSYFVSEDSDGNRDGQFVDSSKPAEAGSSFDAASGTITIYVKAVDLGFTAPGQELKNFNAGVITIIDSPVVSGSSIEDGMPDNDLHVRSTVTYALHDNTVCGGERLKPITAADQQQPTGLPPRFYDFQSPEALADGAGEPTIGYNPASKNAMFIAGTEVDRITFAENAAPDGVVDAAGNPLPEACEPLWQDKSYTGAVNTLDPILETEQTTGRTFQSSLSGANSIFAFSDDDGDTWIPGQAGPPNGGADHQTVGVGPWAPGAKPPSATEDYAVYYCSQSVAAAFCSRSDNGGVSFGPGVAFRNSLTDCGNTLAGLHGHVQVARNDGTVYVPFGNCGDKVATAVSTDSGVTWDVKTIPQSTAGDDPGLGIANDGTAYMCYAEAGSGRVFASVSKDRGTSWSGHYDIGAIVGVKHAVFVTAVAGDGDRAACAFLGTADDGNPEAEDFEGVWHPYVATTYDGGDSWHTVNVAPNDPVQGWGGICQAGLSCGDNRNLLDFNDVIMDDEGRVLFGYADGCRGACVDNPTQNTFSANGVVARQSGGRTLLSAFDDKPGTQFNSTAATKPAAACARQDLSLRTNFETRVVWNEPDTGGSPITNYKVYRSLSATGTFDFVGDAGTKLYFIDATADSTVEKYYYKVVAENAQGLAVASNVIELLVTVPEFESSCELPGVTVASEANAGDCTGTGGGCTPQTDVQSVHVAELESDPDNIVITVKAAALDPAPAPGQYWFVLTKKQDGSNLYVGMETASTGAPRYVYGTYEVGTLTTFTEQGTLTGSVETNGAIHIVASRALFGGLDVGDVISSIEVRTRAGDSSAPSRDVVGPGDYTVRGTKVCLPNTPPVAILKATPKSGGAALKVNFDGTGSYDNDTEVPDTIETYIIDFGDGTGASATDGDTPKWSHTYAEKGFYLVKLRVVDSRGLPSDGAAERVIEVLEPGAIPGVTDNRLFGGAVPVASLLVLAGLLGLRRRKRNN